MRYVYPQHNEVIHFLPAYSSIDRDLEGWGFVLEPHPVQRNHTIGIQVALGHYDVLRQSTMFALQICMIFALFVIQLLYCSITIVVDGLLDCLSTSGYIPCSFLNFRIEIELRKFTHTVFNNLQVY